MATAPLKSQPLHNFSLPQLRWGHKNHINTNHRYLRPSETTTTRERRGGGGGGESEPVIESENRFSFASCFSQKQQSAAVEREAEREKEKPWNLRPRKAVLTNGGEVTETAPFENISKSTRLRGVVEGQQGVEKRKLWIELRREEIEEDVYAMTGSRPARRPKKRPKTVQKQLDNLFPGLYLAGISADSYHIDDAPR